LIGEGSTEVKQHILGVFTHAGIAAGVGRAFSRVCLFVCVSVCLFARALKGKRLEQSTPNLVQQSLGMY